MKQILVIGSGKTTLSGKLAEKTGLPLYHLDALGNHYNKSDFAGNRASKSFSKSFLTPPKPL